VALDPGKGKVVLSHYGGAFRTEYGHLRVPFEVELHQSVDPLQRIGRISNTGVTAFHLHHAHYVKLTRGPFKGKFKPSRMRHGGRAVKVSQAGPDRFSPPWFEWRSDFTGFEPRGFRGWTSFDPKATLRVRVRFTDESRSKTVELGFFVERRAIGEGAIDAGCRGSGLADDRLMIAHRYDGPTLEPGEYSVRYRCADDKGSTSPWAFDHSLVVAG